MVKTLTTAAQNILAQRQGVEPISIIEIKFTDETSKKYADKALDGIKGKILEISDLDSLIKAQSGVSSSLSVVLDDTDGELKSLMDEIDIHKKQCIIYQSFEGLTLADAFVVFKGEISTPIVWSERDRTLSFDIITKIESREIGFAPEEGQFQDIPDNLTGQSWPLAFGSVLYVPAVQAGEVTTGTALGYFGLGDQTLVLKKQLLQYKLEYIEDSYQYFTNFLNFILESFPRPDDIKEELIDTIIQEDSIKQQREDMGKALIYITKQIEIKIEEFHLAVDQTARDEIKEKIDELKESRKRIIEGVRNVSATLANTLDNKKKLGVDSKNAKLAYNLIGKIRKNLEKLLEDYIQTKKNISEISEVIAYQGSYSSSNVYVDGGEKFQQGEPLRLRSGGVDFLGTFSGRQLTIHNIIPTYTGVSTTPIDDDSQDRFVNPNPAFNLSNLYCRLSDGRIIKVNEQDDAGVCSFTLIRFKDPRKFQNQRIKEEFLDQIKAGLGSFLDGSETEEELLDLANGFPLDLSQVAWDKITGGTRTQIIKINKIFRNTSGELERDLGGVNGGTFRLKYGEEITEPINWNASYLDIISSLSNLPSLDAVHFSGGTGQLPDQEVQIGFNIPMQELVVFEDDLEIPEPPPGTEEPVIFITVELPFDDDQANTNILNVELYHSDKFDFDYIYDSFTLIYNGVESKRYDISYAKFSDNPNDYVLETSPITAQQIYNSISLLVEKTSDFNTEINVEVTGGPLPFMPITIKISGDSNAVIVNNFFHKILPQNDTATTTRGSVTCKFVLRGAQEYTEEERAGKIRSGLKGLPDYKKYEKLKNIVLELVKIREDATTEKDKAEADNLLKKNLVLYTDVLKDLYLSGNDLNNVYRFISETEYKALYELEILTFMMWKRLIFPLSQEPNVNDTELYYINGDDITYITEASPIVLPHWTYNFTQGELEDQINKLRSLPNGKAWLNGVGDTISLISAYQEKYIANILPSTVHAVYAYRYVNGIKRLVPVPQKYYTKNENENYGGLHCTTVTLIRPLEEYKTQNWEKGIYVSLTSSVGPNTADIIKWVIDNYTNLSTDTTSYNYVKDRLTNYPSHFAIFNKIDALQFVEDIAWQARCQVWLNLDTLHFRYLPENPSPVDTFTLDDVEEGTLKVSLTDTEDIVTKFTALWKPNYLVSKDNKLVLRYKINIYGEQKQDFDFYIYNIRDLVLKSATFWLIRYANTFKRVSFSTFLPKLNLEVNDCITLDLGNSFYANEPVRAFIESIQYNSENSLLDFTCWIPVRSGEMLQYKFAHPADLSIEDIFPTPEDIQAGYAGSPNNDVPTGIDYDPDSTSDLNFRPNDYGDIKPTDQDDDFPANPSNGLSEIDYDINDNEDFELEDDSPLQEDDETEFSNDKDAQTSQDRDDEPTFSAFGYIRNKKYVEASSDWHDKLDTEIPIAEDYYEVELMNGDVILAKQLQMDRDDEIPRNTVVLVNKDPFTKQYYFQLPVMLPESNETLGYQEEDEQA